MYISEYSANFLNNIFDDYKDHTETNGTKRFHPDANSIEQVLREIKIAPNDCDFVRIEETSNQLAVPPHTDAPQGNTTIIVPLVFTGQVHSITFNSFFTSENCLTGIKYRPTGKAYYSNESLPNDEVPSGLREKPFYDKKYGKLLNYLPVDDLFGLKIEKIFPWKKRKVIKFRSDQLHCGSVFKGSKRWLLILAKNNLSCRR